LRLLGMAKRPHVINPWSLQMYNILHYFICRHALFIIANDQLLCPFDFINHIKTSIFYKNKIRSDVSNDIIYKIIFSIQFETNAKYCFPGPWVRKGNAVMDSSLCQK
jgi:hypothetical protein